jgi:hypothetical protein
MTKKYINDWEKVVRSLITHMKKAGYDTVIASNGEDSIKLGTTKQMADKACECDEGWLRMVKGDESYSLYIVLGNSPSETVADWSWKKGMDAEEKAFSQALSKWSESWELRGNDCPKKEVR